MWAVTKEKRHPKGCLFSFGAAILLREKQGRQRRPLTWHPLLGKKGDAFASPFLSSCADKIIHVARLVCGVRRPRHRGVVITVGHIEVVVRLVAKKAVPAAQHHKGVLHHDLVVALDQLTLVVQHGAGNGGHVAVAVRHVDGVGGGGVHGADGGGGIIRRHQGRVDAAAANVQGAVLRRQHSAVSTDGHAGQAGAGEEVLVG